MEVEIAWRWQVLKDLLQSAVSCYGFQMNAETLIGQIQKLPPEEIEKVGTFLHAYLSDLEADKISAERAKELETGSVKPLSHDEVFGHALKGE